MNLLKPLLTLVLTILTSAVFSQKDAPVVGDAIKLVKLLNKDYNTVAPDQREEQIIRDRAEAIRIFKVYLLEEKNNLFYSADKTIRTKANNLQSKADSLYKDYTLKKNSLDAKANERMQVAGYKTPPATSGADLEGLNKSLESYRKHLFSIDTMSFQRIKNSFGTNEYMKYIVGEFHQKHMDLNGKSLDIRVDQALSTGVQKGLPFIGGDLSFTTAIDGLSRFLATRIKEEMTTYVISKVQESLENPSDESGLNELKVLLPRTVEYLLQFRADQMLNFGDEMKQYIEEDLNNLLTNLPNLRNTPRFERLLEMHPDMDFAFEALELIPKLAQMKNPIEYFEILENSRTLNGWNTSDNPLKQNITNAIDLTCMLARSLTTRETGQLEIITFEEISNYLENTEFYLLYYGMLHQQNLKYYNVTFNTLIKKAVTITTITKSDTKSITHSTDSITRVNIPLNSLMNEVMSTFDSLKLEDLKRSKNMFESMLSQLGLTGDKVNAAALELKKLNKKGEKIPLELVHEFVGGIIDFSDEVALAGDSLVNFLMSQLTDIGRVLDTIVIDKRQDQPIYSAIFADSNDNTYEKFPLYEKVSPYINAARTTNDIILDVHNKNYVIALLKALEIVETMRPNNVLAELTTSVKELSNLKAQLDNKDLAFLMEVRSDDFRKRKMNNKAMKAYENQLTDLNHALTKWLLFYRAGDIEDKDFATNINSVKTLLSEVINGSKKGLDSLNLKKIDSLVENETFRKLILEYYSNQKLDTLSKRLREQLEQFKITIKGKEVSLFSKEEAEKFQALFDSCSKLAIDWAFSEKGERDIKAKDFEKLLNELESLLADYAFAFPSKLSIDPNSQVFRLIHFINDMAKSKDAEDVEKAIEAFALPSGSYAIKRTARWNTSINSYPGILLGPELTRLDGKMTTSMAASLTVPVGLSVSRGSEKCGSIGLFVPIIDIGAFTRVHLDADTNTIALPEINFSTIFSPGLYLSYGFRKSPLSINVGGQYGPQLRRIESNGETKSYESWRVGVGLVLDIPLFNLYTKPRL